MWWGGNEGGGILAKEGVLLSVLHHGDGRYRRRQISTHRTGKPSTRPFRRRRGGVLGGAYQDDTRSPGTCSDVHYFGPSRRIRHRPSEIFLFRQPEAREMDIFSPVSFRFGILDPFLYFYLPLASGFDFFFVRKGGGIAWFVFLLRERNSYFSSSFSPPVLSCTVSTIPSVPLL